MSADSGRGLFFWLCETVAFICLFMAGELYKDSHVLAGTAWAIPGILVALIGFKEEKVKRWFRLDNKRHRGIQVMDGAPRLLCKGISSHRGPITVFEDDMTSSPLVSTARVVGRPVFYHLKIANEPTGTTDRKVAEKVAGRIQIFHENGTPAAKERLHRWENSPGPREVGKSADQLVAINIPPNGIECNLDIAMKYEDEDSFYTPNNETAMRVVPGWREDDFKFPPGTYIAKVHLSGTNAVTDLRCQIVNKGAGSKLEITPLGD